MARLPAHRETGHPPALVGAVFVVAGNFVADISLTVADPRVRLA